MPSPSPPPPRPPAAPSPSPSLTPGPVPDATLRALLAADEAMYPAALPLARLQAWARACPALAVCFFFSPHDDDDDDDDGAVVAGASITLPLRAGPWRALLAGRLAEPDIAVADLAADVGAEGDAVGLHVFHVERFDARARGLAAHALRHALEVAAGMGWRVLGCSALTATDEGARAFAKLGFEPTGYEEIWVREAGGSARLVPILPGQAGGGGGAVREKGGSEEVVGEARMVVRYSDGAQDDGGLA